MRVWVIVAALCFFLAAVFQPGPARSEDRATRLELTPASRPGNSQTKNTDTRRGIRAGTIQAASPGAPPKPSRAAEISLARPKKQENGQKPARPGANNRPGYSGKPGVTVGKPGGTADKPGGWNRPGHQWNTNNRLHRRHLTGRRPIYGYGPAWYGYYYDNSYVEDEAGFRREEAAQEPPTYFSPGQFEIFEDPRLNWVAEGGIGETVTASPPPGARPPAPASDQGDNLRQYEQMMKAWR